MQRAKLGRHGPEVSEICFGSLAISPLQGRVSVDEGKEILRYAVLKGIDWVDTAELYDNYDQLKPILQSFPELKIATKSYAVTQEELRLSLEKARKSFQRDYIDIFLLHEQESHYTLQGHSGAWQGLLEAKAKGLVGCIGISTHAVQGVRAGALQPGVDIIHPILNYRGLGIIDGGLEDMLSAISFAAELGIGIYAMKVLGGGHLAGDPDQAIRFIQAVQGVQAMALGMSSIHEVDFNLSILSGQEIGEELRNLVIHRERRLYAADWCQGCGRCMECCSQQALGLAEGQVKVNSDKCVLCGYCGRVCPHFCLKIV